MRGFIKASDYVAEWIKSKTSTVYGVQGGAAVHLFDSCHRVGLQAVYCHHEQAAGFAAVAHSRIAGFGVCIVTTGPAATNCITPCLGAWQDSIPVLFISGQTRVANMSYDTGARQIGSQEAPILNYVRDMAKGRFLIRDAAAISYWLKEAYARAFEGRPGPVWIDFPVDQQWSNA